MATGGRDERDFGGRPTGGSLNTQVSQEGVSDQSRYLAADFIHFRLEQDGVHAPNVQEEDREGLSDEQVQQLEGIAKALRTIGDELDSDRHLQRLIEGIPVDCPRETFLNVAAEIFADGKFSWGRVVALFYFGYKLARKAVDTVTQKLPAMVRTIIGWIALYIRSNVADWIVQRGGWGGVMEWFGTPNRQVVGVMLAAAIGSGIVILKQMMS